MKERARLIGADLRIRSEIGQGRRLNCAFLRLNLVER
jgi:signal transduction histidine kinase